MGDAGECTGLRWDVVDGGISSDGQQINIYRLSNEYSVLGPSSLVGI